MLNSYRKTQVRQIFKYDFKGYYKIEMNKINNFTYKVLINDYSFYVFKLDKITFKHPEIKKGTGNEKEDYIKIDRIIKINNLIKRILKNG